jgi:nucleotide-binding universal stress UspA family protein
MKIILAIDDSQFSRDAVEEVADRYWPDNTIVRVLSAAEPTPPPAAPDLWYDAGGTMERLQNEVTKHHEILTSQAASLLKARGIRAETAVRQGDARSVIVDEAIEWQADLIVVGSHGYSGIKRWLLGSVAHSVVSHAPCSVHVVRRRSA